MKKKVKIKINKMKLKKKKNKIIYLKKIKKNKYKKI